MKNCTKVFLVSAFMMVICLLAVLVCGAQPFVKVGDIPPLRAMWSRRY